MRLECAASESESESHMYAILRVPARAVPPLSPDPRPAASARPARARACVRQVVTVVAREVPVERLVDKVQGGGNPVNTRTHTHTHITMHVHCPFSP